VKKYTLITASVMAVVLVELLIRVCGLTDFPVYDVDNEIGYLPRAGQTGIFLRKNDWYFNDKNMPTPLNWDPALRPNILLIGNSIVMGGNPYRQQDKLAPQIQQRLGKRPVVWPIAANGWTQVNEMFYLGRHPEVVAETDYFAWEYMGGGLSAATPWAGEYVFPSHHPTFASWYVARRYIFPRIFDGKVGNELPATGAAGEENIKKFDLWVSALKYSAKRTHPGIIWFYPDVTQLGKARRGKEWLPERPTIERLAAKYRLRTVDIAASSKWNESLYRADGVHPTVEGNGVLAGILAEEFIKDQMASCAVAIMESCAR
jgi:hypothetical protein